MEIKKVKTISDIPFERRLRFVTEENCRSKRQLKQLKAKKRRYERREKAIQEGRFLKKEDLVEYRRLIIWILNKKVDVQCMMNLKEVMQKMLDRVNEEKIIYSSEKARKRTVCDLAKSVGTHYIENKWRHRHGLTLFDRIPEWLSLHLLRAKE